MMKRMVRMTLGFSMVLCCSLRAQEMHEHGVPEELGTVSFPISCAPAVQQEFNRSVALLHSFAYTAAEHGFAEVTVKDPKCGMAHWGVAMTYFHQVWSPALPPDTFADGQKQMLEAVRLGAGTAREQGFLHALSLLYQDTAGIKPGQRTMAYEQAMREVAHENPEDVESQVFYAVALLSNGSPADKTHAKQKQAIAILEPLNLEHPRHPGIAHYLIHACDSQELASRGLPAARAYAQIAPSAPHALHMPSHIFTRLGLWDDSIQSNLASRKSAHEHGDVMQELHAMDYLVYAYLQLGRDDEAGAEVREMQAMHALDMSSFGIAYAATAMQVRLAVERGHWAEAATLAPAIGVPPSVAAVALWSKGLGLAHTGHVKEAQAEASRLLAIEEQLRGSGDLYWSTQTGVLANEVTAWAAEASGDREKALTSLRAAADREDALEKLPVTPGPVVPAREQLGELLLEQKQPGLALKEFRTALVAAPGRRGAIDGEKRAAAESAHAAR